MLVLGLDPGTENTGWVIYDSGKPFPIINKGIDENQVLLDKLFEMEIGNIIDHAVFEMIEGRGMPVGQTVFDTCVWIGEFRALFKKEKIPYTPLFPRVVKLHICGSARAKPANVRQSLLDKVGPQGVKKAPGPTYGVHDHEWSALACAVTFADTRPKGEPDGR